MIKFISDEKNDSLGKKGDIYTILENLNDIFKYEKEYCNHESLRDITGLPYSAIIGVPFCMIDNKCYLLKNWAKADYSQYTLLDSSIVI